MGHELRVDAQLMCLYISLRDNIEIREMDGIRRARSKSLLIVLAISLSGRAGRWGLVEIIIYLRQKKSE